MKPLSDLVFMVKVKLGLAKPARDDWWVPRESVETDVKAIPHPSTNTSKQETKILFKMPVIKKIRIKGLHTFNRRLGWLALVINAVLSFGIWTSEQKPMALIFILNSYVVLYMLFKTRRNEPFG